MAGGSGCILVASDPWDIVVLGGPACGVHEADSPLADVVSIQGACEELVVGLVDWVTALEGKHILADRQRGPDLLRGCAGEHAGRLLEALHLHQPHTHIQNGYTTVRSIAARKNCSMRSSFALCACGAGIDACLLYTSPSPRDRQKSRMPSSA